MYNDFFFLNNRLHKCLYAWNINQTVNKQDVKFYWDRPDEIFSCPEAAIELKKKTDKKNLSYPTTCSRGSDDSSTAI